MHYDRGSVRCPACLHNCRVPEWPELKKKILERHKDLQNPLNRASKNNSLPSGLEHVTGVSVERAVLDVITVDGFMMVEKGHTIIFDTLYNA